MAKNDAQMERIKSLMESLDQHSMTESTRKNTCIDNSTFQYQTIGGDGKSYAIVREGKYYYIKSAEADKKNLAEAYDYLGGWMGRKNYEYSSYQKALKNFELKMRSINEAFGRNESFEAMNNAIKHDLMESEAIAMGNEIARYRQIMASASLIAESGYGYKPGTTEVPEAPKKNSGDKNGPFTETAKATLDQDPKFNAGKPANQGEPFGDGSAPAKGKDVTDSDIPSDGKAVADAKPQGGKVTRVNEGNENAEAQNGVISDKMKNWGIKDHGGKVQSVDQADMEEFHINEELDTDFDAGINGVGTGEVGDDAPFDEKAKNELDECGNAISCDTLEEGEEELPTEEGDEYPEDVEDAEGDDLTGGLEGGFDDEAEGDFEDEEMPEGEEDFEDEEMPEGEYEDEGEGSEIDELRAEIEELRAELAELKGEGEEMPEEEEGFEGEEEMPEVEGEEMEVEGAAPEEFQEEDPMLGEEDEDVALQEAKQRFMESVVKKVVASYLNEEKTELHDFGKHPGYRKKVMSLPSTGEDKNEHGKDWNDDSVYSEEPFGNKIGDSAPFDKAAKMITDSIMESLKKK